MTLDKLENKYFYWMDVHIRKDLWDLTLETQSIPRLIMKEHLNFFNEFSGCQFACFFSYY